MMHQKPLSGPAVALTTTDRTQKMVTKDTSRYLSPLEYTVNSMVQPQGWYYFLVNCGDIVIVFLFSLDSYFCNYILLRSYRSKVQYLTWYLGSNTDLSY